MNTDEYIKKFKDIPYNCYYNDKYSQPLKRPVLNCEDDRITRIRELRVKLDKLSEPIEVGEDIVGDVSKVISQMHELLKEDLMKDGNTELEATLIIDRTYVFNHWEITEKNGKRYVSVKPMLRSEYERQIRQQFGEGNNNR